MSIPTVVNDSVFSLAGTQRTSQDLVSAPFADHCPLGVRCYSLVNPVERWVTRWVDDISFRSVVPGGFASANITLRIPRHLVALPNPDPLGFSQLAELFRRVQIVDLRTMEIAWEGRIEDPARQTEPDTWQIGVLGSMVAATDIQRPVFYIDSSLDNWIPVDASANGLIGPPGNDQVDKWSTSKDDGFRQLTTTWSTGGIPIIAGVDQYSWRWDSHGFDQGVARITSTLKGACNDGAITVSTLEMLIGLSVSVPHLDVTNYGGAGATKSNVIGTDFTNTNQRIVLFGTTRSGATDYYPPSGTSTVQRLLNPLILGIRRDRTGAQLLTAASYPHDYVLVSEVVEDVVGRFLVGGWYEGGLNTPWPGSVRSQDVYIDSSNTTQILHLAYPDGATAADILNDLTTKVQTNAYWAIWESKWGAADPSNDFSANSGFRFEWATWPNNWGYLASSQDGFEGQPNGDDIYNFVSYRYQDTGDGNQPHVQTTWSGGDTMVPETYFGGFTRAVTVNKQDPTNSSTAASLATAYRISVNDVKNAGTLTVRRPIPFYDTGANSASGASRLIDPWMIRPGKLVRIIDLPPRALERDASFGSTLPSSGLDGTIFKVVATEYNSSDNSCRMELDQVSRWQVPTQIAATGGGSKTIRIQ